MQYVAILVTTVFWHSTIPDIKNFPLRCSRPVVARMHFKAAITDICLTLTPFTLIVN